ncbi:MAG: hypothetical protein IID33_09285 [Planctomycetes bacterium]|nr:hypothetical protein [Planctomycetota bacterium]
MDKPDKIENDSAQLARPADPPAERKLKPGKFFRGIFGNLRNMGTEMVSVALGRLLDDPAKASAEVDGPPSDSLADEQRETNQERLGVLHGVTEKLRGAADTFVAAKLDEIEARVDTKLDEIETRLDSKLIQIHRQLGQLRDKEIRHRLRLLKLTLMFTVLVALLSLGYKWLSKMYIQG